VTRRNGRGGRAKQEGAWWLLRSPRNASMEFRRDRSPDLRLAPFPSQRHKDGRQWVRARDELRGRISLSGGAYSCGAVADSHRFPEHPGDFSDGFRRRGVLSSHNVTKRFSMTSTFINGGTEAGQNRVDFAVHSQICRPSRFPKQRRFGPREQQPQLPQGRQ
jgi:hypothetical protein